MGKSKTGQIGSDSMEITRLGVIHIPGSAGSSLGTALGQALGCRYLPVHRARPFDNNNGEDIFTIEIPNGTNSLSRELLLSYPLISGHLSIGQLQATFRTHIILVVAEPRLRLIKLFAHHAAPGINFEQWLTQRISYSSEIIDQLMRGIAIPENAHWSQLHAMGNRAPLGINWEYQEKHVAQLISPINQIFLTNNPQFVIDRLYSENLLMQHVNCERINLRSEKRAVNWGNLTSSLSALKNLTKNDYKFIAQVSPKSAIDPNFKVSSDEEVEQFFTQMIALTS